MSILNSSPLTYRVKGIPLHCEEREVKELLQTVLDLNGTRNVVQVGSLAISPDQKTKMATVDFKIPPSRLSPDGNQWSFEITNVRTSGSEDGGDPKVPTITIDTHFLGITILQSPQNVSAHKIE